jgi:hypothetical protein
VVALWFRGPGTRFPPSPSAIGSFWCNGALTLSKNFSAGILGDVPLDIRGEQDGLEGQTHCFFPSE